MGKILISALPAKGHLNPLVAIGLALVEQGHEVMFATDERYRAQLQRVGLPLEALPYPDGAVDTTIKMFEKPAHWMAQLRRKPPESYFFDHLDLLTKGLIDTIRRYQPDALLTDLNFYAGSVAAEACNLPYATYCAIVAALNTPDAPPYGLGLDWVPSGHWQRWLWPILNLPVRWILWRHDRLLNPVRRQFGLEPVRGGLLDHSPYLSLVPTTETYEYPRRDLPRQIMYVGPVTSSQRGEVHDDFPWKWFDHDMRPTVYVSMGTIVGGQQVFQEVIEAARGAAWKAVLAVGMGTDVSQFVNVPDNVLIRNFVPQLEVLKRVDAVVSHGGNNTVTETLMHGLPLVVIPFSADQPESAGRIKAAGVGIRMRPGLAQRVRLRRAIEAVLTDPHYQEAAQRVQQSYARCNGTQTAAALVGRLAVTGQPIMRPDGMRPTLVGIAELLEKQATGQ
ncbi:MAG: glycosyltransferase [Anaerolineales bacterium]|nr:glycosyltransferase [Anaerolineales bacterium]